MNSKMKQLFAAFAVSTLAISVPTAATAGEATAASIEEGKKLAFNRSVGNCLACHAVADGAMPGNIGPALIAMKLRYPDKQKLVDKVWGVDKYAVPNSMMPPFGKHGILTDSEINKIVDFIYTL